MESELKNLFNTLNKECKYLILRNWDNIFDENIYGTGHEDIDILCEDKNTFVKITGAKSVHKNKYRDNFLVQCGSLKVRFDVRWIGDGYYPAEWEKAMLENRILNSIGVYIMNNEDYCFSLSYHAVLQKPYLSVEYLQKINDAYNVNSKETIKMDEQDIVSKLKQFLAEHDYNYIIPSDPAVYINWDRAKMIGHHFQIKYRLRRFCYRIQNHLGVQ